MGESPASHEPLAGCLHGGVGISIPFAYRAGYSSGIFTDMSPKVHCNLCNHCYTLGMPDPRPDIRCVQCLPKIHYKVPIKFSVPSGTSDIID